MKKAKIVPVKVLIRFFLFLFALLVIERIKFCASFVVGLYAFLNKLNQIINYQFKFHMFQRKFTQIWQLMYSICSIWQMSRNIALNRLLLSAESILEKFSLSQRMPECLKVCERKPEFAKEQLSHCSRLMWQKIVLMRRSLHRNANY